MHKLSKRRIIYVIIKTGMGSPLAASFERRLFLTEQLSVGTAQSVERLSKQMEELLHHVKLLQSSIECVRSQMKSITKKKENDDGAETEEKKHSIGSPKEHLGSEAASPGGEQKNKSVDSSRCERIQDHRPAESDGSVRQWDVLPSSQEDSMKNHRLRTVV